jgi:hypothetical protein
MLLTSMYYNIAKQYEIFLQTTFHIRTKLAQTTVT